MARDQETRYGAGRLQYLARSLNLMRGQPTPCGDSGLGRIEPQDGRLIVEPAQPGVGMLGCKLSEELLEQAGAMRFDRVAIVVPRDDRHPFRVVKPGREGRSRRTKLARQGRGAQISGDQDVVGAETGNPVDQFRRPFEPEPCARPRTSDAVPSSRLPNSRSGLNSYCQK